MENNILEYKGYYSKIQYNAKNNLLFGKIESITDLVTFESENCSEIKQEFMDAIDDYLEFCKKVGKSPEKPYKGSFNIRITPENHKKADDAAKKQGITLNQFVSEAIASHLEGTDNRTIIYYPFPVQNWSVNNPVADKYIESKLQTRENEVQVTWQK